MHSKAPTGKNTSLMMVKIQTPWGGQKVTFLAIFGIFVIFSEKNGHFPNNPKLKGPKIHHFLTPSKNTSKIHRDAFPKIEDFLEKSRKKTRPKISSFEKCQKIHRDAFPKIALFGVSERVQNGQNGSKLSHLLFGFYVESRPKIAKNWSKNGVFGPPWGGHFWVPPKNLQKKC